LRTVVSKTARFSVSRFSIGRVEIYREKYITTSSR
jgi:hypothetical protein